MTVLLLELNEINFDQVRLYCDRGNLPVLKRLIARHGVAETTSEDSYEKLEPWIQWVTAHSGRPLDEHGVFRLGDIVKHDIRQIWEHLEEKGLKVGAISPMNGKNRCRNAAFFVPDPWTQTPVTGSATMKGLSRAIGQAVNDNASSRLTAGSAAWLLRGLVGYALPANYPRYLQFARDAARGRPWAKAMVLDQLLADIFVREVRRTRPDFASLFLNAGAHIQHHYMFNSAVYDGAIRNPEWYAPAESDPVEEVYRLYDNVVGQIERAFPDTRLMLATGLHQDAHPKATFYWRLRNHAEFFRRANVPFREIEPRMSRDFVMICADADMAKESHSRLLDFKAADGSRLFEVDNRGTDLFVSLIWENDIPPSFEYYVDGVPAKGLRDDVAFVAIKNGQHNGIGYFLDTGTEQKQSPQFPLSELPKRVAAACGTSWDS